MNERGRSSISTTVAIVAFYFEASLSRSVLGSEQGRAASRYTFFCGVLAIIMIAAAWGQRRVTSRWAGVVVVLATVSFANNISVLGDGSAFYTDRMQISRARLALGFEIIDRGMAEFAPDPEFASDLSGDRLHAVLDSPYDDEFMVEAKRCFQRWDDELSRAGVAADSLPDEQRAALLVLLSEHSLGAGSAEATLKELIEVAAFNDAESGLFAQFSEAYGQLLNAPPTPTDFVPSTVRCT